MDASGFLTLLAVIFTAFTLFPEHNRNLIKFKINRILLIGLLVVVSLAIYFLFFPFFKAMQWVFPFNWFPGFDEGLSLLLLSIVATASLWYVVFKAEIRTRKINKFINYIYDLSYEKDGHVKASKLLIANHHRVVSILTSKSIFQFKWVTNCLNSADTRTFEKLKNNMIDEPEKDCCKFTKYLDFAIRKYVDLINSTKVEKDRRKANEKLFNIFEQKLFREHALSKYPIQTFSMIAKLNKISREGFNFEHTDWLKLLQKESTLSKAIEYYYNTLGNDNVPILKIINQYSDTLSDVKLSDSLLKHLSEYVKTSKEKLNQPHSHITDDEVLVEDVIGRILKLSWFLGSSKSLNIIDGRTNCYIPLLALQELIHQVKDQEAKVQCEFGSRLGYYIYMQTNLLGYIVSGSGFKDIVLIQDYINFLLSSISKFNKAIRVRVTLLSALIDLYEKNDFYFKIVEELLQSINDLKTIEGTLIQIEKECFTDGSHRIRVKKFRNLIDSLKLKD